MRSRSHTAPIPGGVASLAGITLLILGIGGCGPGGGNAEPEGTTEVPRNVRVMAIAPIDLNEYLTISGPALPVQGTDLAAEENGQVSAILYDRGSAVQAGESIIVLDRRLLEAQMRSADAARDLSAYEENRTRQLFDANSVSRIEMLDAETRLRQAAAAADAARIRFERAAIRAPFDGIVADRYVELGQLVAPGTPVARVIDPYVLKIEAAVSEREVRAIEKGKRAIIRFDGVKEPVTGTVHWVGFEAEPMTGKFGVEIRVANRDLKLRPGVVARARVLKAAHEGVIAIPRDAIVQRSQGPTVFVVEGELARQRRVALGPDQGLMVIVTEGLATGDRLVVRGHREIHDGSLVSVREEATSPDGTTRDDPTIVTQEHTVSETWESTSPSTGEGR